MIKAKTHNPRFVVLSGGVGGAKLVTGFSEVLPPEEFTILANTGDDFRHLGLHISPDLDTLMYTLAGLANPDTGWGLRDESWNFMDSLGRLQGEDWFRLGDKDLATHLERTRMLSEGLSLDAVTEKLCAALNVQQRIVPMSNDTVATVLQTDQGQLAFQDYFVRLQAKPAVRSIEYTGGNTASPTPAALEALQNTTLEGIILTPSNPFLSVAPILSIPAIKDAIA
ncbi:MAG: 2-phospho-L-lactate transferase CofD family protein, partial [Gammaproteobacteria bacterium]